MAKSLVVLFDKSMLNVAFPHLTVSLRKADVLSDLLVAEFPGKHGA